MSAMTNAQAAIIAASNARGVNFDNRGAPHVISLPDSTVMSSATQFKRWLDTQDAADSAARVIADKGTLEQRVDRVERLLEQEERS